MKRNFVFVVFVMFVLALVVVFGCTRAKKVAEEQEQIPEQQQPLENPPLEEEPALEEESEDYTIEITSIGFNPKSLSIDAGDRVTFVNKDSKPHWPASDVHPTHTVYPESGGCIGSKFDACKGLGEGESYSFRFNEKGSWDYHDHLRPSSGGTISVK